MHTDDAIHSAGIRDAYARTRRRPTDAMRDEIAASWSRSRRHGVQRDVAVAPPHEPGGASDERLVNLAAPVLERVSDDVRGAAVCLVLAAENARILDRRVSDGALRQLLDRALFDRGFVWSEPNFGTNAIGTSLERQRPIVVRGREHYASALRGAACASTPVMDPRTGRLLGAVGLACDVANASALMLPYVRRVGREVESRLLDGASAAERVLLDHYVRARLRCRGPILAIDERNMTTNAAAARLVGKSDHGLIWESARRAISGRRYVADELHLLGGARVLARCEPVLSGGEAVGALVRLDARETVASKSRPGERGIGWGGLSAGQLGVAELVASGLTNREAAARLYVSPHTIDFHLRQIYNKLRISSRVELARLVAEQHAERRRADDRARAAI
jgi:DNA-binding CsgD family transcriptional regulator